jgi:hypothetical protein
MSARTVVITRLDGRWIRFTVNGRPRQVLRAAWGELHAWTLLQAQAESFGRLADAAMGRVIRHRHMIQGPGLPME